MEFTETFHSIKIKQFFTLIWIFKLFNHRFQMEYACLQLNSACPPVPFFSKRKEERKRTSANIPLINKCYLLLLKVEVIVIKQNL